eukprot:764439-Hanusia_phi.AAC.1
MPVQVTSDDLVGSVQVDLQDIPEDEPRELTLSLQNQKLFKKLRDTRLVLIVHKTRWVEPTQPSFEMSQHVFIHDEGALDAEGHHMN